MTSQERIRTMYKTDLNMNIDGDGLPVVVELLVQAALQVQLVWRHHELFAHLQTNSGLDKISRQYVYFITINVGTSSTYAVNVAGQYEINP